MDSEELNQALETQRFNRKRLELLKKPVIEKKAMVFAPGKNSFELRAIDMLQAMEPDERTELLGQMFERYEVWFNDQQKALFAISGD